MKRKPSYNWQTQKTSPLLQIAAKLRKAARYSVMCSDLYRECAEIMENCPPNLQSVIAEVMGKVENMPAVIAAAELKDRY